MMTNKQIIEKISKAENIALFAHIEPDADACASMFGLRDFCQILGKNAVLFCGHYGEFVSNLFPVEQFKTEFSSKDYDLVVLLDLHVEHRIDACFVGEFRKCKNVLVLDHHVVDEKETVPTKNYRILHKASASQLVLDLYREIGQKPSKETATYLYTGLVGDTDRFLYLAGLGEVFEDAKCLLDCGVDFSEIYNKMYRTISHKEITLTKFLYSNICYFSDKKVALMVFTGKDLKKLGANTDDVKLFSNTLLNIKGVKWSLLVYEVEKNLFKFSMRSAPELDLIPLAIKMGGGGHKNAAAFTMQIKASQIKKTVKSWVDGVLNG